jgi:2-iminobutanoate/2-iminopropanoate deaminase
MKVSLNTKNAPAAIGPYSQAISSNGFVFISGQLPVNPENNVMPEGIEAQTEQSLRNIKSILESAGLSFNNVVKTTVFLKDMNDFNAMNNIYKKAFSEPYPARVAIEVARLPKDAKVEIEAFAAK